MRFRHPRFFMLAFLGFLIVGGSAIAADWPMWRADERRSAAWEGSLPETLHLQWVREYPPLTPAYHHPRLQFDLGYEPIVTGQTLIVGSSGNDRVTALDTETGAEKWRFYTEGPVRFAPAAWNDKVYFGSDDGFLYCLDAHQGTLLWKFQAVPSDRKLLGNGRLISVWPVRGGPMIADGTIYFAAGVWSFEGVFVYALDAETGDVTWVNDRTGFLYGQHPHDAKAFGGLTPQGYLVVQDDELIVPCGTALPARFDRTTGQLKSFALPRAGRAPGGWFTAASKAKRRGLDVPAENENESEDAQDGLLFDGEINRDRHEGGWYEGPGGKAGVRSRISLNGKKFAFEDGFAQVEGTIHCMLAADRRLFVVTREGRIYAFGADAVQPKHLALEHQPLDSPDDGWSARAANVLAASGVQHGHAVVCGVGSGRLIEELARQSELQIIAVDPDGEKCHRLRQRLDDAGLLGVRLAVHHAEPLELNLPPYLANLIVSEDPAAIGLGLQEAEREGEREATAERLFQVLRPFGGTLCLALSTDQGKAFEAAVGRAELDGSRLQQAGELTLLSRVGGLSGSSNYIDGWSSPDDLVKAPLGVLWFDDSVAVFKRAPQPMIVDGVMISYDKDWMGWPEGKRPPYPLLPPTYSDVYTGRVLSKQEVELAAPSLPTRDLQETQPDQYRPPSQKNAWKPEPPVAGERINPLTGVSEPRAFPKSYGCDGGIDYSYLYTMRSGTPAYYDKRVDSGTVHISGPRSGCTNSIIPANGLLNVPYFYQGCTCSYPLPVGLALFSLPQEHEQWAVWGPGKPESIQRVGINFGAPGSRMTEAGTIGVARPESSKGVGGAPGSRTTEAGTLWLAHPHMGGPAPEIRLTTTPETPDVYYRHSVWMQGGTGWPWVAASGARGLSSVTIEGLKDTTFTVRLYFAEPQDQSPTARVFDVAIQDEVVVRDFDISGEAGGAMRGVVKEFSDVRAAGTLKITLIGKEGDTVLSGIELIAKGLPLDEPIELAPRRRISQLSREAD